jgi:curved DNA-binding protein
VVFTRPSFRILTSPLYNTSMQYRDYYQSLGVDKSAPQEEIKRTYRKLARQYHPDVNPGDKAAEDRFKEINEAYEVLSDPEKRQKYDQFGSQWQQYERTGGRPEDFWQQWGGAQGGAGPRATYTTINPEDLQDIFGAGAGQGGFSDFFEALFGRGGMGGQPGAGFRQEGGYRARPRRGQDTEHTVQVTLDEAFRGATRSLQWEDGRQIQAKIPPGVRTGSRVRFRGEGTPGAAGGEAGDLYLRVEVLPHPTFQRDGDDLRVTLLVDLYTAVLGGQVEAPTLERPLRLTIPPETNNGRIFRLRGQGMPQLRQAEQRGDLFVTVNVQLPRDLTDEEKRLFEQLRQMRS